MRTAVGTAIEELTVDLPEELASGKAGPFLCLHQSSNRCGPESDLPSPDEWEDNSVMASESDVGLAESP